jgi:hypothetical protein
MSKKRLLLIMVVLLFNSLGASRPTANQPTQGTARP